MPSAPGAAATAAPSAEDQTQAWDDKCNWGLQRLHMVHPCLAEIVLGLWHCSWAGGLLHSVGRVGPARGKCTGKCTGTTAQTRTTLGTGLARTGTNRKRE